MKKHFILALTLVAIALFAAPAAEAKDIPNGTVVAKIDNVVKVFMHNTGEYSVLRQNGEGYEAISILNWTYQIARSSSFWSNPKTRQNLFKSKTGATYVELVKVDDENWSANIYIDSLDILGGAEYRCGKNCRGMTSVVK